MLKRNLIVALIAVAGLSMGSKETHAFFGKSKSEVVQITGSDTILNVTQQLSESYMGSNKDARIAVTGGGSGVGIAAAINGTTDIAMASRSAKDKEKKAAAEVAADQAVHDGEKPVEKKVVQGKGASGRKHATAEKMQGKHAAEEEAEHGSEKVGTKGKPEVRKGDVAATRQAAFLKALSQQADAEFQSLPQSV